MPRPINKTVEQDDHDSMRFTQTLPMDVYKALMRYTKDKGFSREQEVLRVWTMHLLTVNGYWPMSK